LPNEYNSNSWFTPRFFLTKENDISQTFQSFSLNESVLKSVLELGYEIPTPIQREIIPYILKGQDVLGQAQTGTGKTAAFALPLLTKINLKKLKPQILVLAPTRELALQVSEAFKKYAQYMDGFHVLPIYGGQSYTNQLKMLKRGVHVIVGTPGRIIDHLKRKTLVLDDLMSLVLDEADEMLKMGFMEDVEWIMKHVPKSAQISLFSATLPARIKDIANNFLKNPKEIKIQLKTATAETIHQRYWMIKDINKLDALTRILESEPFESMIIFVRTKNETIELAEKLDARGYSAIAINGDIPQKQREKIVDDLKKGKLDILIATDVAARGLDVERITHVINYDVPYDTESYIHRIGRTGRAGRKGEAILFVSPREFKMLKVIQKATNQTISEMTVPTKEKVNEMKKSKFVNKLLTSLSSTDIEVFKNLMEEVINENNLTGLEISASLAKILYGIEPKLFPYIPSKLLGKEPQEIKESSPKASREVSSQVPLKSDRERYSIEIGSDDGLTKDILVDVLEKEAGLDKKDIKLVELGNENCIFDLPKGMPKELYKSLKKFMVLDKPMKINKLEDVPTQSSRDSFSGRDFNKRRPSSGERFPKKRRNNY
jgi:ATP-dependent RNA helicase DeaD